MIENIDNPTMAQKWSALHMACEIAEMIAEILRATNRHVFMVDETMVEVDELDPKTEELLKSAFPFVSIRKSY